MFVVILREEGARKVKEKKPCFFTTGSSVDVLLSGLVVNMVNSVLPVFHEEGNVCRSVLARSSFCNVNRAFVCLQERTCSSTPRTRSSPQSADGAYQASTSSLINVVQHITTVWD